MNRTDLAQKIASIFYLRQSFSKNLIDQICIEIGKTLRKKERVYLQKLGAFHTIKRPARRWYDPHTGKIKIKPAYTDIIFRPSKQLLRQLTKK